MAEYAIKEVPEVIIKYQSEDGITKSLKLNCIKDYTFDYEGNGIFISLTLPIFEQDFFDILRKKVMNNKYYEVSLSATNFRRNINGEDEVYMELEEMPFRFIEFKYFLSSEGKPASIYLKLFKELS